MSLLNEWVAGVWNVFCILPVYRDSDSPELWSIYFNIIIVQNEKSHDIVLAEQPVMVLQC